MRCYLATVTLRAPVMACSETDMESIRSALELRLQLTGPKQIDVQPIESIPEGLSESDTVFIDFEKFQLRDALALSSGESSDRSEDGGFYSSNREYFSERDGQDWPETPQQLAGRRVLCTLDVGDTLAYGEMAEVLDAEEGAALVRRSSDCGEVWAPYLALTLLPEADA